MALPTRMYDRPYETAPTRPSGPRVGWLGEAFGQRPPVNWCEMRLRIRDVARRELTRWRGPNGGILVESQPSQLKVLTEYWSRVPGFSSPAAALAKARRSARDEADSPWSAAFICYVMHTAGVRRDHGFQFSGRHIDYIVGALRNRERSQRDRPFWLVDALELQHEARPQPGDLLCFNRPLNGVMTTHTFPNLRQRYWLNGNQARPPQGSSHTALVIGRAVRNGRPVIRTIGGNEGNTVRLSYVPANPDGTVANPAGSHIFGMIKIIGC
jgi:Uncharacterized protein conserved in bacteria (DUF2272)